MHGFGSHTVRSESASSLNGRLDAGDLVSAQAIRHDDVPWAQFWREKLLHAGHKGLAVDWPIEHQRHQQAIGARRADKRRGVPVSARRMAPGGRRAGVANVSSRKISRPLAFIPESSIVCRESLAFQYLQSSPWRMNFHCRRGCQPDIFHTTVTLAPSPRAAITPIS